MDEGKEVGNKQGKTFKQVRNNYSSFAHCCLRISKIVGLKEKQ
jgi:hypothetical protein